MRLLDTRHSYPWNVPQCTPPPHVTPPTPYSTCPAPNNNNYVIIGPVVALIAAATHSQRMATHILFESASGYAIFEVKLRDELASMTEAVQKSIQDLGKFKKMVSLLSFSPFKNAAHALENANDISEGPQIHRFTSFRAHVSAQARSTRI